MSPFFDYSFRSMSSHLQGWKIGRRQVPAYVIFLSLCAATGGLMFGYDIGISGGVTVMDSFLCQIFPGVLQEKIKSQGSQTISISNCSHVSNQAWQSDIQEYNKATHKKIPYCLFGNQRVQLFTSSLYFAAMMATIFAAYVSKHHGRKRTILLASIFYFVGVIVNTASATIHFRNHGAFYMLIFGRIMLGIGVGFGNQAVPLFISEIAPADARGSLNYLFQLNITIGIFMANVVNWGAQSFRTWGWSLSLGLAIVPATLFLLGSFFLIETPSSLVQRGLNDEAKKVLGLIREKDVSSNLAPLQDVFRASKDTSKYDSLRSLDTIDDLSINGGAINMKSSKTYFNGLFARSNMPPLLITIFVQLFQQFTGINVVMLYAPVLFTSFGSRTNKSLLFVIIIGTFNVASTCFSILFVDRIGRRRLLLVASGVMFFTQLLLGILLIGTNHKEHLEDGRKITLVVLVCTFVGAFECSWGPLAWLISTEIFPLKCRSEGQSVAVFSNMLFTFVIAHTSLSMLCTLKYGIFFFFATWVAIMGIWSFLFLPETMNMDIEIVNFIWSFHKFWKYFVSSPPTHPFSAFMSHHNPPQPNSSHWFEMNTISMDTLYRKDSVK